MSKPAIGGPQLGGSRGDDNGAFRRDEYGTFRQGTALSQWALARYLVGRSMGSSLGRSLLLIGLAIFGVAAGLWWGVDAHSWAIFFVVLGLMVFAARAVVQWILSKLTAVHHYRPVEKRLRALVADTRRDVLRELRRVGLPGHLWTLPLLAVRLVRPSKRADTVARIRLFEVARVVPRARLDELHMLVRSTVGR